MLFPSAVTTSAIRTLSGCPARELFATMLSEDWQTPLTSSTTLYKATNRSWSTMRPKRTMGGRKLVSEQKNSERIVAEGKQRHGDVRIDFHQNGLFRAARESHTTGPYSCRDDEAAFIILSGLRTLVIRPRSGKPATILSPYIQTML